LEGNLHIVTANATDHEGPVNAPSGVVSPKGEWLVRVPPTGEHRYLCDIELEAE
jgi:hypothetical protein